MKKYELMFIVKPDLEEKDIKATAESLKSIIVSSNSKLIDEVDMGQKELAYEINKYKTGYYFLFVIEAEDDKSIKEFDRVALINENVIRHLIVKVDE